MPTIQTPQRDGLDRILFELATLTSTPEATYAFLAQNNLILRNLLCISCQRRMHLEKGKTRHAINNRWRCSVRTCRKSISIFANSLFENVHMPLNHCLYALYFKAMGITTTKIAFELGHNAGNIANFINKALRIIDTVEFNEYEDKIGATNEIIEIDETHLASRRDNRGRILASERYWVIGCINRITKEVRCCLTRNRTRNICETFINNNINVGSTIMSDRWRGYTNIRQMGYTHFTINHSVAFVDYLNPEIHTQTIERFWRSLEELSPQVNSFEHSQKHVIGSVFLYNLRLENASDIFQCYLNINKI